MEKRTPGSADSLRPLLDAVGDSAVTVDVSESSSPDPPPTFTRLVDWSTDVHDQHVQVVAKESTPVHSSLRKRGLDRCLLGTIFFLCGVCLVAVCALSVTVRKDSTTLQHNSDAIHRLEGKGGHAPHPDQALIEKLNATSQELAHLQQKVAQMQRLSLLGQPEDAALVCRGPYRTITDARRRTNTSAPSGHPSLTAVDPLCDDHISPNSAPTWVRFSGAAGLGLATVDPRSVGNNPAHRLSQACGTTHTGWLSGFGDGSAASLKEWAAGFKLTAIEMGQQDIDAYAPPYSVTGVCQNGYHGDGVAPKTTFTCSQCATCAMMPEGRHDWDGAWANGNASLPVDWPGPPGANVGATCPHNLGPAMACAQPGTYPRPADGIVERTVCFHGTLTDYPASKLQPMERPCYSHVQIHVVHCGDFLLWQLPNVPQLPGGGCPGVYCTTGEQSTDTQ
eukprot:COSAG03_NODE_2392_length_2815_cov_2.981222_2_plen_449_part_00